MARTDPQRILLNSRTAHTFTEGMLRLEHGLAGPMAGVGDDRAERLAAPRSADFPVVFDARFDFLRFLSGICRLGMRGSRIWFSNRPFRGLLF